MSKTASEGLKLASCSIVILVIILFIIPSLQHAFGQPSQNNDNLWYFGKGIKQDTYLKYRIYDNHITSITDPWYNYTQGIKVPFDIVIYFERYDNDTGYWVAPVFVMANGTVLNYTFHIDPSKQFWNVFFGNSVSPEMKPYKYDFYATVVPLWLFATEPGSPLNAKEWLIDPEHHAALNGTQNITVPAGTFNCTEILTGSPDHVDKTYINKDLPYPVKGPGFELEKVGQGYPNVPEFPVATTAVLVTSFVALLLYQRIQNVIK